MHNSIKHFVMLLALSGMAVLAPVRAPAADLTCPSSTTLVELVTCIKNQMPVENGGYDPPSAAQQDDLLTVVGQMLDGDTGITLPASLTGIMQVDSFTDTEANRSYMVLMEILDADEDGVVDSGFGTFIVDQMAVLQTNIAAPHPLADFNTWQQSIQIFQGTFSRSFQMAGAHRRASTVDSTCQSTYKGSDVVHNDDSMFLTATQALLDHYGGADDWHQLQFHGMATSSCPGTDIFLSHGEHMDPPPAGDIVHTLKAKLLEYEPAGSSINIALDDGVSCELDGGSNTAGRLINGIDSAQVCTTAPWTRIETFIHVEQKIDIRTDPEWTSAWISAINDTFPCGLGYVPPVGEGGTANLTLLDDTVTDTQSYHVCDTITVGPNYAVSGPDGDLTLQAGRAVVFGDDTSVGIDGTLTVLID